MYKNYKALEDSLHIIYLNSLAHLQYIKDCPYDEVTLFDEDLKILEEAYLFLYAHWKETSNNKEPKDCH